MPPCTYYEKPGHHPSKCRFKDAKCHHCSKVGHIKPACLALKKDTDKTVRVKGKNVKTVQSQLNNIQWKSIISFI